MNMQTTSDKYSTLDSLRGVAAMLVVMYHFPGLFRPVYVENSYLVVDLFFVMSGFVIASAYEEKLSRGDISPLRFMRLRLIRLYPLYALGTLLGTAGLLWRLPLSDWHLVASALPLGLLMIPCPLVMRIFYPLSYAERVLYPLNYPSWSLFFELLANAGYAVFFKYLSTRVLLMVVAASGVMLIAKGIHGGKPFSAGWILAGSYGGLLRIAYSFSTGILLFRFRAARRKTSNVLAIALVAAFILLFCLPIPDIFHTVFIFSIAIFVFPVLVWVAAAVEPSHKVRKVFLFFGAVSYGVYVLHVPVGAFFQLMFGDIEHLGPHVTPWVGAGLLLTVVALASIAEKIYDIPVRRRLLKGWIVRKNHPMTVDATLNQ
ncbi:acyltransferase [Paraburkholderia caribensis]|uniref:Acyltransferase n=1 Tax=Paraburkholderia caribensis TaxID=75105 RepID=A0A9Q6SA12_9BURK|nr:acyltransferase [Paraburkholderia caribensis]MCO4881673.1 acyltransferase [Paraburkholderia caribensis]PTB30036.1 hypothetical protein C9I56_05270 [Paraburkholderia caribensis]QLB67076.1 hypothetical protein A9O66_31805 [Paraburkholderia caribensis]